MSRILIVINSPEECLIFKIMLERYKFETFVIDNAKSLSSNIDVTCQYDAAIVDAELITEFRQVCSETPIIVLNPLDNFEATEIQGVISKIEFPYNLKIIGETLTDLMSGNN